MRPEVAQELGEWAAAYVRHLQTARKLAEAHDQLVQPQKRADLRAGLEAALARLVELRHHLARHFPSKPKPKPKPRWRPPWRAWSSCATTWRAPPLLNLNLNLSHAGGRPGAPGRAAAAHGAPSHKLRHSSAAPASGTISQALEGDAPDRAALVL